MYDIETMCLKFSVMATNILTNNVLVVQTDNPITKSKYYYQQIKIFLDASSPLSLKAKLFLDIYGEIIQ
jgi:hypothetical protein